MCTYGIVIHGYQNTDRKSNILVKIEHQVKISAEPIKPLPQSYNQLAVLSSICQKRESSSQYSMTDHDQSKIHLTTVMMEILQTRKPACSIYSVLNCNTENVTSSHTHTLMHTHNNLPYINIKDYKYRIHKLVKIIVSSICRVEDQNC